jgi:hypothetical protein
MPLSSPAGGHSARAFASRVLCVAALIASAACASAPLKKADIAVLDAADARVLEGCYDCLLEARAAYERVAVGKARPLVLVRLFETQLLIVLREKELAIDTAASSARAQALASELPPEVEANRYLDLVNLVPPDAVGTPRRESQDFRRAHQAAMAGINDDLTWLKASTTIGEPVRQYLSLSLDCAYLFRAGRPGGPNGIPPDLWTGSSGLRNLTPDTTPLLAYRAGTCRVVSPVTLGNVRTAVPRFVETALFLGRMEVAAAQKTGGRKARELLTEAYARFPASPAVTYLSGSFHQVAGNCREALRYYDETLTLKAFHEDAMLGRTMCLTFLARNDDAIASATHMIDIPTDNWGRAFYWRAWNYHHLKNLPLARADVDRAKPIAAIEEVYTLAGIIEHDQDDLTIAETDLNRAKQMDPQGRNCTAMWYLGLVKLKREAWPESGANFGDAMECYDKDVKDDEKAIADLQARDDVDPEFKASQITNLETELRKDRSQYYAAAFNTANQSAHAGDVSRARTLLDIAAKDPALADLVGQLREILK